MLLQRKHWICQNGYGLKFGLAEGATMHKTGDDMPVIDEARSCRSQLAHVAESVSFPSENKQDQD